MKLKFILSLAILNISAACVLARPSHIQVDLSTLKSNSFELVIELTNGNGINGDSYVLLDNFICGSDIVNFEDGTISDFFDTNSPGTATIRDGEIDGQGSSLLYLKEDNTFDTAILFKDYSFNTGDWLTFDLDLHASSSPADVLKFSLVDIYDLEPSYPGLDGKGTFLIMNNQTTCLATNVTATTIPAPASVLLTLAGAPLVRRFKKSK